MSKLTDCECRRFNVFQRSRTANFRNHPEICAHVTRVGRSSISDTSESQNRHQASSRNWLNQPSFAA